MKILFDFLPKVLQKRNLQDEAFAALILKKTNDILKENFGDEIVQSVVCEKFWNGKIFLRCSNGAWKQQIFLHKKSILLLVRAEFPKLVIEKIILKS